MGRQDPASHGYRTATPRTQSMFQNAGTIYVYFTYGVHYCVNIVTGAPLDPQAVLIRALEPTEGINIMSERRGLTDRHRLCRGPGNLTKALAIDGTMNGTHIGEFIKLDPPIVTSIGETIAQSPRIGVTKAADRPWRYYISGSKFVSGPVYPNT
jgi:DNA-3-methyladenine glycosylase